MRLISILIIFFPMLSFADAVNFEFSYDENLKPTVVSMNAIESILWERKDMLNKGVLNFYVRANFDIIKWKTLVRNLKVSFKGRAKTKATLIRSQKNIQKNIIEESFVSIYGLGEVEKERLLKLTTARGTVNVFAPSKKAALRIQHKEARYFNVTKPVGYYGGTILDKRVLYSAESSSKSGVEDLETEALGLIQRNLAKYGYTRELSKLTHHKQSGARMPASIKNSLSPVKNEGKKRGM